jgi:predicted O-methyltransferase YrrM
VITASKLFNLFRLLPGNPSEVWERVSIALSVQWDRRRSQSSGYAPMDLVESLNGLGDALRLDLAGFLTEDPILEIQQQVTERLRNGLSAGPFSQGMNADFDLARCCYVICRALKPSVVLETGVAYGVTTSFVLKALAVNGKGRLWSVDLPPLGRDADQYVGILVPHAVRDRWHFQRGTSQRLLPRLLPSLDPVDLFIHDSLHTSTNMRTEFETVWPYLRPAGVLLADDVDDNQAFAKFSARVNCNFRAAVGEQSKASIFGILLKGA